MLSMRSPQNRSPAAVRTPIEPPRVTRQMKDDGVQAVVAQVLAVVDEDVRREGVERARADERRDGPEEQRELVRPGLQAQAPVAALDSRRIVAVHRDPGAVLSRRYAALPAWS